MDNSYGLAELHEQLLIIMDDIDRVCRNHNIRYTLSYGTLLGAIRHKGFIPWDDDMDIFMIRSEFERFKIVYEKEKNKDFIIGHPCNLATYSVINPNYVIPGMVKKEGTIVNPWVTIFPLDNAPKNKTVSWMKATRLRLLSGMMGKPTQYANFTKKAKKMWDITTFAGKIVGNERSKRRFELLCVSCKNNTGICSSYTLNTSDVYARYPSSIFVNVEDCKFEDRVYKIISEYKEFLTITYGSDYMIPVSEKERKPLHLTNM